MTLLFSQKTYQFVEAIEYRHLEPLNNCTEDVQFFGASKYDWYLEDILIFSGEKKYESVPLEDIYNEAVNNNIYQDEYSNLLDDDLF
jgi:hypothetical protein